jgi:hypothetical protein
MFRVRLLPLLAASGVISLVVVACTVADRYTGRDGNASVEWW